MERQICTIGSSSRRLVEFGETPTSELTIEEFMRVDLDQECDPPSFLNGLRKKKFQQVRLFLCRPFWQLKGGLW